MPVLAATTLVVAVLAARATAADDGRRAIDVPQFGIATRAPLAWTLIEWGRDDLAFVLRLPQENGSPPGSVSCRLEFALGTLEEWHKQYPSSEAEPKNPKLKTRLVRDEIEQLDPQRFKSLTEQKITERWVRLSESSSPRGRKTFELTYHVLFGGVVYNFALRTDEEHFDAYRADFDDLSAATRFQEPTKGLARLARGFWLNRDCGFAVWLPAGFRPAYEIRTNRISARRSADDKNGAAELLVAVTGELALDLDALRAKLPAEIVAADQLARVDHCQIVAQGQLRALETVVYTRRGEEPIAIFIRQFRFQNRNFELRAICPADEYEGSAVHWERVAESVREVEAKKPGDLL